MDRSGNGRNDAWPERKCHDVLLYSRDSMNKSVELVVFTLDEQHYALNLQIVRRVVRAVEITPLPKAPEIVLGVVNVQGDIIPIMNIRNRFNLPEREMDLSDQLIVCDTSTRVVALLVDAVGDVIEQPYQGIITSEKILPEMEYVEGVLKLENSLIFIHDLDTFLSLGESEALDQAIKERGEIKSSGS